MIRRIFTIFLLGCTGFTTSRAAEPDLLRDLHRFSNSLENGVRNAFVEDSDEQPSPTPKHHKKSGKVHTVAKHKAHKHSTVEESSPSRESDAADGNEGENRKSTSGSTSKSKHKHARSKEDESDAPSSTPTPTPTPTPSPESTHDTGGGSDQKSTEPASTASIKPEALEGFSRQPAEVQQLIRSSLALTEQNLSYKYGSADPSAGGMDCSGFIYYVLNNAGYKDVPRDSAEQYAWVRKQGDFRAVLSHSPDSFEFDELKPGDLLFWSGTYQAERDIPITHVMIYLGKTKSAGKPVMVGSTDGRSYDGIRRYGVSVFDFKMPSGKPNPADPDLTSRFEGYASIPGLRASGSPVQNKPDKEAEHEH